MNNALTLLIFLVGFWASLWVFCSTADDVQCAQYDMTHYKTTWLLEGYCQRSDGLIVPAWRAGE